MKNHSIVNQKRGFTIVELLIVVIVIGVLAGIVLNTIGASQRKARDTQRTTDLQAVYKSLELYYQENDGYPLAADFDIDIFNGLNPDSIADPRGVQINTTASDYSYTPTDCDSDDCRKYSLAAELEDEDDPFVIDSIN